MDTDEYLKRIGVDGKPDPSLESLESLMRSHLCTVPFENLDVYDFGTVPSLDPGDLYEKIVLRRRGGYCFELGAAFEKLLESLGFDAAPVAVRVLWNRTGTPPVLHRATVVTVDGRRYYCDVGFGGPGPGGPLPLEGGVHDVRGSLFEVSVENGRYTITRIRECRGGRLLLLDDGLFEVTMDCGQYVVAKVREECREPLLMFDTNPVMEVDFELPNYYCSAGDRTVFTSKRMVNLTTEDGSLSLNGDVLTRRAGDSVERTTVAGREETQRCLDEVFGLKVDLSASDRF